MKSQNQQPSDLPLDDVIKDCLPLIRPMARGQYAISIGGSIGKGTFDQISDVDFRLFCEETVLQDEDGQEVLGKFLDRVSHWRQKGVEIDGCWVRRIEDVNIALNSWIQGNVLPDELVWTIWGYHLPTDINNQHIIEDPDGIIAHWKKLLSIYPPKLKKAILVKHSELLRYWRNDYHYRNKVNREDIVFLAGLSSKLVHDIIQILFALNEVYYVGDGWNLRYISKFTIKPEKFEHKVKRILYPSSGDYEIQYLELCALIDDVLELLKN